MTGPVEKRVDYYHRRYIIAVMVAVGIAYALLLLILASLVVGQQQAEQSRNLLLDCTRPSNNPNSCYNQSQRRTADAVRRLVDAHARTVECAQTTDNPTTYRECVRRQTGVDLNAKP